MLPFFYYYCEVKNTNQPPLMKFDGFCKFCSDFSIFPDILSKPKIFNTLASFYAFDYQKENIIDEHLFIEAIALTAFEVVYKNP